MKRMAAGQRFPTLPKVHNQIQQATEHIAASGASAEQAVTQFADILPGIVGVTNTQRS